MLKLYRPIKFITAACILVALASFHPVTGSYKKGKNIEQRIDSLMAKMTLDDKIGQTAQRGASSRIKGPVPQALVDAVKAGKVGSLINIVDIAQVNELQRIAVTQSPRHIPIIFSRDVIHGFKTIFPIPLGQAATWDVESTEEGARIAAMEASSVGIRWTFAPMLDIARDARWGRIAESPGEDPYLASAMANAYIAGFQGKTLSSPNTMAACAKHFAGYGAAEGGRDYNTANIPEPLLRDIYLKPFKTAKNAGVATFMASFNDLNGVPASGNRFLLRDILRKEWRYDGMVVSDWNGVIEMINHGYAADEADAARKAANAGIDMEMASNTYELHLRKFITTGKVSISELNVKVRNILRLKFRLGLFDTPYTKAPAKPVLLSDANLLAAKKAAVESAVLLKNDHNILPLTKPETTVAVIGPLADAAHDQLGTWTFDGEAKDTQTPLRALQNSFGNKRILFSPGLEYSRQLSKHGFNDAVKVAKQADVIVFFGGEESILSGEAHSRANLDLPGAQDSLILELRKTGKPIVLVIMAGRPITLSKIINNVDAIIMAWHPGTMGGPALVDILSGAAAPGGRLPVTWPKTAGQEPLYYNHTNTGRPATKQTYVPIDSIPVGAWQSSLGNTSHYLDAGYLPQYPFGYGLGYTTFSYEHLLVVKKNIKKNEGLQLSAEVTNTGSREGTEVVQLYVQQLVGDMVRPVKELKGFKRITLKPGQSQKVSFTLPAHELAYHNQQMKLVTDAGKYKIWIGKNSAEGLEGDFEIK
ncbi:MAG: beta-glucosidase BglX [Mucilaginibacter sp.]